MAYIRASQGGGGELSEFVVWTNSSPTSNFPASGNSDIIPLDFGYQISQFKYLKFVFRISNTKSEEHSVMVDAEDFKTAIQGDGHIIPMIAFVGSTATYGRRFYYNSDNSIVMELCRQVSGSGNARNYVIPVKIIGLK